MHRERRTPLAFPAFCAIDDVHLVGAMARGDRTALAALYDRHAPLLLALGTRVLGDRTQAEEVLHEVFLDAWHRARDFDVRRGSVYAWLVSRMRSRSLHRCGTPREDRGLAGGAARDLDLDVVLELAYFDGLSSGDIAAR